MPLPGVYEERTALFSPCLRRLRALLPPSILVSVFSCSSATSGLEQAGSLAVTLTDWMVGRWASSYIIMHVLVGRWASS